MVKISDLRVLELINVNNGKRMGTIHDIDLDIEQGKVRAFIMPGGMKNWMLFKHREEQMIPWEQVSTIGQDVILVDLEAGWENTPVYSSQQNPDFSEDDF